MTAIDAGGAIPTLSAQPTTALPLWRRIVFRVGIVLTAIMATMNTINGGSSLLGMQAGGEATSPLLAGMLFGIGLPTLLLVGIAWRPTQWALVTVILLRFLEAATMWVPFGPGDWYQAPEQRGFYLILVVVSLAVCALMSAGLVRRR